MSAEQAPTCKYYLQGACVRGNACNFSHSRFAAEEGIAGQVCSYFLEGTCAYGSRCRYLHVRPDGWAAAQQRAEGHGSGYAAPALPRPSVDALESLAPISQLRLSGRASAAAPSSRFPAYDEAAAVAASAAADAEALSAKLPDDPFAGGSEDYLGPPEGLLGGGLGGLALAGGGAAAAAWHIPEGDPGEQQWGYDGAAAAAHPSLRSLCMAHFAGGACARGPACHLIHGDYCSLCGKFALHPADEAARAAHADECRLRHERLAARSRSSEVECSICLERVLSKPNPADRKFGLLACEHPFCLGCIRAWRQKVDGGADVDTALRTCPLCRQTTWYITPSSAWPATPEEKEAVVSGYRAKLAAIDCKFFAFGEGSCPFGYSCHYRHQLRDGTLEEPGTLRKAAVDEGEVRVLQPVRLSDFISVSSAGQRLGRRRR